MQSESRPRDTDVRAVLDALRRIVRDLRKPHGGRAAHVTPAQLFVLHALDAPRAATVNELAARTYTHQSSVSVVAKTLVQRGFVSRRASATDGRRAELTLTSKGRAALAKAGRAPQERLVAGIARLAPAVRRDLASSLGALVRAMQIHGEDPAMFFTEKEKRSRARS